MVTELLHEGKRFLSSNEAAKVVGYDPDYIGQLCRRGKLVCIRVGKSWFVDEKSLLSYKSLDLNHHPSKAHHLNGYVKKQNTQKSKTGAVSDVRKISPRSSTNNSVTRTYSNSPIRGLYVMPRFPVHRIPFKKVAKKIRRSVPCHLEERSSRFTFSSTFTQKVGTLVLSTMLVMGPYFATDTPLVHQVIKEIISYSGEIQRAGLFALVHPEDVRLAIRSSIISFARSGTVLSNHLFVASVNGAKEGSGGLNVFVPFRFAIEVFHNARENVLELQNHLANRMMTFAERSVGRTEEFSFEVASVFEGGNTTGDWCLSCESVARQVYAFFHVTAYPDVQTQSGLSIEHSEEMLPADAFYPLPSDEEALSEVASASAGMKLSVSTSSREGILPESATSTYPAKRINVYSHKILWH